MRMPLNCRNCRIRHEPRSSSARDLPSRRDRARRRLDDWPAVDPQGGSGRSRQGRSRDCEGDRTGGGIRRTIRAAGSAAHGRRACVESLAVSRGRCWDLTEGGAVRAGLRCHGRGTASRRCQSGPHRVKRQVQAGEPRSAIGKTVEMMEELWVPAAQILSMPATHMTHSHRRGSPVQPWRRCGVPELWQSELEGFLQLCGHRNYSLPMVSATITAKADVFDYIERFYDPKRRHSTLGYVSPEFEIQAQSAWDGVHETGGGPRLHAASCPKPGKSLIRLTIRWPHLTPERPPRST